MLQNRMSVMDDSKEMSSSLRKFRQSGSGVSMEYHAPFDLNARDVAGQTALYAACKSGTRAYFCCPEQVLRMQLMYGNARHWEFVMMRIMGNSAAREYHATSHAPTFVDDRRK